MTQENKETEFDVRKLRCVEEYENGHIEMATEASVTESPTKLDLNSRYGVMGRVIRPTIQFVSQDTEQSEVPSMRGTTESRLADVRKSMTFTRAKKTIRRTGWYFTEPYAPCGKFSLIRGLEELTTMFGNEKEWVEE